MTKFRKLIASLSVVAILSTLVVSSAVSASTFNDVPADAYFAEAVEALVESGCVDTTGKTSFFPNNSTTRAEVAKLLVCATGKLLPEAQWPATASFPDVAKDSWAFPYVESAKAAGIVNGYANGNFGPNDLITREQFAKMVVEAFDLPMMTHDLSTFADSASLTQPWAPGYMQTAVHFGVVTGSKGADGKTYLNPTQSATRGQAVTMINRATDADSSEDSSEDDDDASDDEDEDAPAGDLEVEYSSEGPETGDYVLVDETQNPNLVEYRAPVGAFEFTANDGDVTVTELHFTRKGFLSDDEVDELSLYLDGEFLTDGPANPSSKKFDFKDKDGLFTVEDGETVTVELKLDLENTVDGGVTLGFDLTGVLAEDNVDADGVPVAGPLMSTADGDLASATIKFDEDFSVADNSVGAKNEQLAEFDLNVQNNDVRFESLTFTLDGSVSSTDLKNFKLTDDKDKEIATASSLGAGKTITFSDLDLVLDSSETYRVYGDIVDGAGRDFTFTIDEDYESFIYDEEQDVRIKLTENDPLETGDDAYEQEIEGGDFDVERADNSPIGGVAVDSKDAVLARYEIKAGGEKVKVTEFEFEVSSGTDNNTLKDLKVNVNGSQKGTAKSTAGADTNSGDDVQEFTFGSSFTINAGETAILEITADLDDASLTAGETLTVLAGTLTYDLLESNEDDQTATTPVGFQLVLTQGSLDVTVSSDSPDSKVVVMGTTTEVARWNVTAEDEDLDILDLNINFTMGSSSLEINASSATLKLYKDGQLVDSVSRSIQGTSDEVWFGNDSDKAVTGGTYQDVDNLDWALEEDEDYEVALELTFKENAEGGSAPVSGVTFTTNLNTVSYEGEETTDDGAFGVLADTHELRAASLRLVSKKDSYRNQSVGASREVAQFSASELGGKEKATLGFIKFTLDTPGTATATGQQPFTIKEGGSSSSNTTVAELSNVTPTSTNITAQTTGTVAGLSVRYLTFAAAHGLQVGNVFRVDTVPRLVVALGDSDGANTATVVAVTSLAGASSAAIADLAAEAVLGGNSVFLEQTSLLVPFVSQARGEIAKGGTRNYFVVADTNGLTGSTDTLTTEISAASDVYWWDGEKADGSYTLADLFTSSYIDDVPLSFVWDRD